MRQGLLILLIIIFILLLILYFFPYESSLPKNHKNQTGLVINTIPINETETTFYQFKLKLTNASHAAVIMNITGSSSPHLIYDCGARVAYQLAAVGKNVSNYVFNGEDCVDFRLINKTVSECEMEISNMPAFYISYSPKNETSFFPLKLILSGDEEYLQECVSIRRKV